MPKTSTQSPRFYWLDILRGLAALCVVLWHWPHFFFNDPGNAISVPDIDRTQLPLYSILRPFYGSGWRAVELFFTLSGFIFFWLYADKISRRTLPFSKYLVLRISRLYPLHLATLLVVIVGQHYFRHQNSSYFVYGMSVGAFFGNLTLTGNWFSTAFSFNGPVWSVSIEMLMYLLFFGLSRHGLTRWWQAAILVAVGWLLRETRLDLVGTGMMSFFAGGVAYHLFGWLRNRLNRPTKIAVIIGILPVVLLAAVAWKYGTHLAMPAYFIELAIFPLLITTLALAESTFGSGIGKHLHVIGDISYSSYLLHFPLQLGFVLTFAALGFDRSIFYQPGILCLFYGVLVALSLLSFYRFERPVQNYLRRRWTVS